MARFALGADCPQPPRKAAPRAVDASRLPTWAERGAEPRGGEPRGGERRGAERGGGVPAPSGVSGSFPPSAAANGAVCLWRGSIVDLEVDGIVNAANEALLAGGGVCGAIHDAAGPELQDACEAIGTPPVRCPTGETVITDGYGLAARHVLHTVGPIRSDDELLRSSYQTTLEVAARSGLRSVGLCCVSTGIFGFPLERATHVALRTVRLWLDEHPRALDRVIFTTFRQVEYDTYERLMPLYFPFLENAGAGAEGADASDACGAVFLEGAAAGGAASGGRQPPRQPAGEASAAPGAQNGEISRAASALCRAFSSTWAAVCAGAGRRVE